MTEDRRRMEGRTVLITGATWGIGRSTALALARMGADLILVGRNEERLDEVQEKAEREGCASARTIRAELSSMAEVRKVGEEVNRTVPQLHVLVNNVGVILGDRRLTADGYEHTFALDHLCSFLLTNLLLDKLKASAPSRIINVSSIAHIFGRIRFDDLMLEQGYRPFRAYGQAKLANVLFTRELARRLKGTGVTANALHPGMVNTHFGNELKGLTRMGISLLKPFEIGPDRGARTTVYLASSPEVEDVTGEYFVRCRPAWSSRRSRDMDAARRLWEESERLTGLRP